MKTKRVYTRFSRPLKLIGVASTGCCILLFVLSLRCFAQLSATGSISGAVRDPSGASIPEADVIAANADTGIQLTTHTNNAGSFAFPSLRVGNYTITVSKSGFETYSAQSIVVHPSIVTNVDVTMVVGAVSTHVNVFSYWPTMTTTTHFICVRPST